MPDSEGSVLNSSMNYPAAGEDFGDALYIYSFEMMVIGGNWWALVKCLHLRFSLAWVSQSVKRGETIVQQKGYDLIDS